MGLRRSATNHDLYFVVFFFNDTATTEIYTLSLHDVFRSPVYRRKENSGYRLWAGSFRGRGIAVDRKSTRLNSSHGSIPNAAFCLKKTTIPASNRARHAPECAPARPSTSTPH